MKQTDQRTTRIIFLILPNANMFDFAGASQVFYEAIQYGLQAELSFCAYENNIRTSTSIPLGKVDSYKKQKVSKGDYVIIVSAEINFILSKKLYPGEGPLNWIREAYAKGATVCGICNGVFLLGLTGLLDGKKCTTHWKRTGDLRKKFPFALVQENILYIEDEGIITSAGATSGIDVALFMLSKLKDDHFTYKISREMVIYNRRSGTNAQQSVYLDYRNHVHSGIHKVQDWLQQNLHKKVGLADLAEQANMSERNFTRIFKKETQLTVNDYITILRKEKIKELLKNPDISRPQIAKLCGLKSERQISRIITN
jgi:transcriptional regulator GlxA family with amidase domain